MHFIAAIRDCLAIVTAAAMATVCTVTWLPETVRHSPNHLQVEPSPQESPLLHGPPRPSFEPFKACVGNCSPYSHWQTAMTLRYGPIRASRCAPGAVGAAGHALNLKV